MDDRTKQLQALGREQYDRREFDKAERTLRQILARGDARYADVFHMLGVVCHDGGRLEEAQAFFEEALQINPHYTEAALSLAVTYNELGRYEEAARLHAATRPRAPSLPEGGEAPVEVDAFVKGKLANLHADLAKAYLEAGMPEDAILELRKAVMLCPTFGDLRVRLASIHRQLGELEAARFELEEALRVRPGDVAAHVALGVTLLALGRTPEAVAAWQRALTIDPDSKSASMYLRMSKTADAP